MYPQKLLLNSFKRFVKVSFWQGSLIILGLYCSFHGVSSRVCKNGGMSPNCTSTKFFYNSCLILMVPIKVLIAPIWPLSSVMKLCKVKWGLHYSCSVIAEKIMSLSKTYLSSLFVGKISIMKLVFSGRRIWVLPVIIFSAQIVRYHGHNYKLFQGQYLLKHILDHIYPSEGNVHNHKENIAKIKKTRNTYRDLSLIRKSNWSICIFLMGL